MSDERRVFTTQIVSVLSPNPAVRAQQEPTSATAREVAVAQLQTAALKEGYQVDERSLSLVRSSSEGDRQEAVYEAWGRPVVDGTAGPAAMLAATAMRFTPLNADGRPRLDEAFVIRDELVDLRAALEPISNSSTVFGDVVHSYRVRLTAVTHSSAPKAYEAGLRASRVIARIHRDLDDVADFALELWGDVGMEDRWAYVAVPWLHRPEHNLSVRVESDDFAGEITYMEFTQARTAASVPQWPADAPPVVDYGHGPESLRMKPTTQYMMIATPVPPPSATCRVCGHPEPDHDLDENGKPHCSRTLHHSEPPSCSSCRRALVQLVAAPETGE